MGFMDKAKKMAEQAQAKIDEVQQGLHERQQGAGGEQAGGQAVEYDKHGRPTTQEAPAQPAAPATDPDHPIPDPSAPGAVEEDQPAKIQGDPLLGNEPAGGQDPGADRDDRPPSPPSGGSGLTSGDPLAG